MVKLAIGYTPWITCQWASAPSDGGLKNRFYSEMIDATIHGLHGRRDRHRLIWLAGEPQRVPDGLEHGPVMACAQGLIPLKDGWRFHDQTLFRVEPWRSFPQSAVRNVKGNGRAKDVDS